LYFLFVGGKMDVDFIFKIAAIGIIVTVLNQVLIRSGREEQAMLTTLAGLVVVLLMVVNAVAELFTTVKSIFGL
jgi:stage III sporulation protein AC